MEINFSYDKNFDKLIEYCRKKYGDEIFEVEGIGSQLDLCQFAQNFYKTKTTADVSVDANANVEDMSVIAYENESGKPLKRLNSLYLLWKYIKQYYDEPTSNRIIEQQIAGDYYINDLTGVQSPYSYFGATNLNVKINGKLFSVSMAQLFDMFAHNSNIKEDYEEIINHISTDDFGNTTKFDIEILDVNNNWVKITRILRHKKHNELMVVTCKNGCTTIVTQDHPIILEDGTTKNPTDLTLGQSKLYSGDNIHLDFQNNIVGNDNLGYFIGFFCGDGHYHKNINTGSHVLEITQKNIRNTKIYEVMNNLGLNPRLKAPDSYRSCDRISVYNKVLYEKFANEYKILHRSQYKNLPVNTFEHNKEFACAMLSGLIDSDGSINPDNGLISIRMTSFNACNQVKQILRAAGIPSTVRCTATPKASTNTYRQQYELTNVSFRLNKDNVGLFYMSDKIQSNKDTVVVEKGKYLNFDDYTVESIRPLTGKTKDIYDGYVYDITTETGHFYSQGLIQHNCFNFSAMDVCEKGLPFVSKVKSNPPKHLSSFLGQMIHFSVYASNSILGACGLADLLIVSSWYVDKLFADNPAISKEFLWKQVKQELQSFIFSCNQPFRGGIQSGFYNISLYDDVFLEQLCSEYCFPDDTFANKETIKKLQEIYVDLMNETLKTCAITFPVTTACFAIDGQNNIEDKDFIKFIAEKNKDFAFINIYCGKTSTLSSCCRLRSDRSLEYFNQFGAGGTKIGSLGVVTLNLPRLAIKASGNKDKFFAMLSNLCWDAIKVNATKRNIIKKRIENGNHPLYTLGFMDINKQYATLGINGLNECVTFMGFDILTAAGQDFVLEILNFINSINNAATQKYKAPHNCEQTPSESSAVKIAKKDYLLRYQSKHKIYSNQFIPLTTKADMLDRIKLQGLFDNKMSGGSICHCSVETRIEDPKQIEDLIITCAKMGVIYWAINYNLQQCEDGHMSVGRKETCGVCGKPIVNNFTRTVGFLTNIKNWSCVRREVDYPNRQFYESL